VKIKGHPLLQGNPAIKGAFGYDWKVHGSVNKGAGGAVEVVAEWAGGYPLAAIRYDLPALITSITCWCWTNIESKIEYNLELLLNAIALSKAT